MPWLLNLLQPVYVAFINPACRCLHSSTLRISISLIEVDREELTRLRQHVMTVFDALIRHVEVSRVPLMHIKPTSAHLLKDMFGYLHTTDVTLVRLHSTQFTNVDVRVIDEVRLICLHCTLPVGMLE